MYDSIEVAGMTVEYVIDETKPGPRTYCAACAREITPEDERIVLRFSQKNGKNIRPGMFLCFEHALRLSGAIRKLLGYEGGEKE